MAHTTNTQSKPKNTGTKQLFRNPVIEKLSRTHIMVPISILGAGALFVLYLGISRQAMVWWLYPTLFIAGLLSFTLIEYVVHRYVFHMIPSTERRKKLAYAMHGVHHDYPKDKDRLAMPPVLSATISFALFYLFYFLMGNAVFAFFPGFIIGYISYLGVHYIVHAFQPPKNAFKALWVNHGVHHYKHDDKNFGVSSPLWDYVFGTIVKRKS